MRANSWHQILEPIDSNIQQLFDSELLGQENLCGVNAEANSAWGSRPRNGQLFVTWAKCFDVPRDAQRLTT